MPETLETHRPVESVIVVRLNRPNRLNALNEVMVGELEQLCAELAADQDVRAVVLTGAGRGFCAGIDVRDFGPGAPDVSAPALERMQFQERMARLPQVIRAVPQPVIAAVNGPCVGGGFALALAADVRICSAAATFGNAAIKLGLSGAEMGMSYHLPRIVGPTVAADWMLTGRTVTAEEADRRGLVSEVLAPDQLEARAVEIAAQIADFSPLAIRMTKRALQVNVDAPDLASAVELENRNQLITHATAESAQAWAKWSDAERGSAPRG
jgi:enoyl-CoA hydratase/carnithine racemase